jgi:hypothetical protein
MDDDGYGIRPGQTAIDRLLEDCRTLSPAGIERVATGWERRHDPKLFGEAERAALHVVEAENRGPEWDELRNFILGLTERGQPLVAWQAEHGETGHKAEQALLAAALALVAGQRLDAHHRAILVRPMAEALPWLVPATTAPA